MKRERKYFIAKHDLASFQAWPGVIWRIGEVDFPRSLKGMQVGDRWVEFAYINDERSRDKTSQIVGFYECELLPSKRIEIPRKPRSLYGNNKLAWAIEGRAIGWQPSFPVTVPPIDELLGRKTFGRATLTPIVKDEFERIRRKVKELQLDPKRIPILNRDPGNEQEVVGILLAARSELGIERIDRIRTRFPDLRVKLVGKRGLIHLEVETYSANFVSHGHSDQVRRGMFKTTDESEKLPVAVACWYDNDKYGEVAGCVHKVYELRSLLQRKQPIRWGR